MLTFTPDQALAYQTDYFVTVATSLKDVAGNALSASLNAGFTTVVEPDTLAPSVVSTTPANAATDVVINTTLVVIFSEPVDTTPADLVFGVSPTVSGQLVWSAGDTVLTFTPDQPLANETVYGVTIATTLKDKAGNALSSALNISFTTAGAAAEGGAALLDSITRPAQATEANIVFNNNGDALAAWLTQSASGLDLSYAFYTASTAQWNVPQTISPVESYKSASNGTDFALAWTDTAGAHVIQIANGVSSAVTNVDGLASYQLKLVSNNSGYALAWMSGSFEGFLYTAIYDGSWAPVETMMCPDPDTGSLVPCWSRGTIQLASNGIGYAVSWIKPQFVTNLVASIYKDDGSGTAAWQPLETVGAYVSNIDVKHELIRSGQGYAAAWHTNRWWPFGNFAVQANAYDGNAWGAVQELDTTGFATNPSVAASDNGFAVAWQYKNNSTGVSEITARVFRDDGAGFYWTVPDVLVSVDGDVTAPIMKSNGQGYAVAWSETAGCAGCGNNIAGSIYDAAQWGASQTLNTLGLPATGETINNQGMQLVSNGLGYAAAWIHDDSTSNSVLKLVTFDNNNWSAESDLDDNVLANHQLTTNNSFYAGIWSHIATDVDELTVEVKF